MESYNSDINTWSIYNDFVIDNPKDDSRIDFPNCERIVKALERYSEKLDRLLETVNNDPHSHKEY
jgi:hypothetical protein